MSIAVRRLLRATRPSASAAPIQFRAAAAATPGNADSFMLTIPATVRPGDGMLLVITSSSATLSADPTGWTPTSIGTKIQNSLYSRVLTRVAQTGDAGSILNLSFSAVNKASVAIVAYANTYGTAPSDAFVNVVASVADADTTSHVAPSITTTEAGEWLVSIATDKAATATVTTSWTVPSGHTQRAIEYNTGTGASTLVVADSNGPVPVGATGTKTFTADQAQTNGITWSLALRAGGQSSDEEETPNTPSMMIGVTAGTVNVDTGDWRKQNMPWLEAQVGRMGIRRTFQGNIPSNFSSTYAGADVGVRASWQSIRSDWSTTKNGAYDAAITAYLNTIPVNHQLLLTWCHEPENDGGNAADFRASAAHVYQLVKSVRPQTLVGPIFMAWTFDSRSSYVPTDWMPDPATCDFVGVDPYQNYLFPPAGAKTVWDPIPPANTAIASYMNYTKNIWHLQPALAETACGVYRGSSGTGADDFTMKRDWIKGMVEYFESNGTIAFCYFDTNINNDLSPKSLIEDDATTTAYWSSIVASHQRGVM